MIIDLARVNQSEVEETVKQLKKAVADKKCWSCGCFHNSLAAIEKAITSDRQSLELKTILKAGRNHLLPAKHDCLGCNVCYPALAINSIEPLFSGCGMELEVCPSTPAEGRKGWPPLPGAYTVLRYKAPVAICTLTDKELATAIVRNATSDIAIVGTLQTENLGIERLISNIIANPHIRFLILCGEDSRQAIGHLPGQSLWALACSGIDANGRIVGAEGKRAVLNNVSFKEVDHFRHTVEIINQIGNNELASIIELAGNSSERNPGIAEPFASETLLKPLIGYLPQDLTPDPAGYFIVYVDRNRKLLSLEHYQNDGLLDTVIEGRLAAELYNPAIEKKLVSRLDHAAYLGRELARAERALVTGAPFVQDAAPELKNTSKNNRGCSCGSSCKEVKL